MSGTLRSASLRYVGLQQDTSIYELQSAQFANKYFIISGEGSRRLMASPEVVGFDSYRSLLGETVDALRFLFPIEEACFRSGSHHGPGPLRLHYDSIVSPVQVPGEAVADKALQGGSILKFHPDVCLP